MMIWKMKILLKNNFFGWYLRRGVILTKDNLVRQNWQDNKRCVFYREDEPIKHLFFQCRFARSTWSIIQVASNLYPSHSVANIFGNWLHGIDTRLEDLLGWERLPLSDRYGYVEMIKCLMIKILLPCRSFTGALIPSIYGLLFSGWNIATYLRRSIHGWRMQRGILFSNMGDSITCVLTQFHLTRSTIALLILFIFLGLCTLNGCVHLSYAEAGCNA
jgi:hypothetical protein